MTVGLCFLSPKACSLLKVVTDAHRLKTETGSQGVRLPQALTPLQTLDCGKRREAALNSTEELIQEMQCGMMGMFLRCLIISVFLSKRAYCFNKSLLLVTIFLSVQK